MEEFMGLAGNALMEMRLTVEGAVKVYQSGLSPLYQRAISEGNEAEAIALDTLEAALGTLQDRVRALQAAHMKDRLAK